MYKKILKMIVVVVGFTSLTAIASVTYDYDDLGRLIEVNYGSGNIVTYTYDPAGNRTSHKVVGPTLTNEPNGPNVETVIVLPISGFIILPISIPVTGSVIGN